MGGFGAGIFGTSSDTDPVRVFSLAINEPMEWRRVFKVAAVVAGEVADAVAFVEGLSVALITGLSRFEGVKKTSSLSV